MHGDQAGDEEWDKRGKGAHTLAQLAAGQHVTGGPKLAELLGGGNRAMGQAIVAKVRGTHPCHHHCHIANWQCGNGELYGNEAGGETSMGGRDVPLVALDRITAIPLQPRFGGRFFEGMLAIVEGDPGLGSRGLHRQSTAGGPGTARHSRQ